MVSDEEAPKLDYAAPDTAQAKQRKDSIELFREPPALSTWSASDLLVWIISFVVVLLICIVVAGWMWSAAWK
jgi:hypothetical protein